MQNISEIFRTARKRAREGASAAHSRAPAMRVCARMEPSNSGARLSASHGRPFRDSLLFVILITHEEFSVSALEPNAVMVECNGKLGGAKSSAYASKGASAFRDLKLSSSHGSRRSRPPVTMESS
jgi:hypothetical protein